MTTWTYPMDGSFPAFPTLSLTATDDWRPAIAPDSVIAVVKDSEPGTFRTNVIASIDRRSAGEALGDVKAAAVARVKTLVEGIEIDSLDVTISGFEGFVQEIAYSEPAAGTLVQAILLVVVENGPAADVVQVVGSVSGDCAAQALPEIRRILQSLTISL